MNLDQRLLRLLKSVRFPFFIAILSGTIAGIFTILQAQTLSRTIARVFLKGQNLSQVLMILLLFVCFSLFRSLFNWLSRAQAAKTAQTIKDRLRIKLINKIFLLGPSYTQGQESGELSNTLLNGIESLDAYFRQYVPQLFFSAAIPLTVLVFVFPKDLLSGFVMLLTAPVIPVFMMLIGHLAQSLTDKQWKMLSRLSAYFLDVLQGLTTLKLLGRSKQESDRIFRMSDLFRKTTMNVLKIAFLSALVLEMAATISTAVIAVEVGLRLLYAKMEFEQALFILILAPEFYQPLRLLGSAFHAGMEGVSAAERIFSILGEKASVPICTTAVLSPPPLFTLSFRKVSFRYPGSTRPALYNINLQIPQAAKTALVGPSGAGKSTLSQLLLRLIQADEGAIFVNELPLSEIPVKRWRKQIAWIPQAPYLFNETVAENIALAKEGATEKEIISAAQMANVHDFIQSLPLGYQTVIGERGFCLSGGQAQRLALARAFLRDAPLLIMDEPTSNLDPALEEEIQQSIQKLSRQRTTLIIAHRLNTIRSSDRVIMLSEGKIVDAGKPDILLTQNGPFARMLQTYGEANR